ncbi:MAG: hypothetical protein FXF47_03310 [Candidatus Mcinerneyibacterium aminivorans]|uniref:Uncharacterized protein n=1 Tax=Candidatus Mcinerneyibacterium aminivorans TaxID=2703815 RepID=A0A5D0MM31_9BACT|nr:MAG: hypothetical protein FXF47_03310 [Candidatus Mcinerneyibacterium aminivorans]
MRNKIISFILIIIFVILFFSGIFQMKDIALYDLHSKTTVKDTEFVQKVKDILKKIKYKREKLNKDKNEVVAKKQKQDRFYIRIYYIMTSPKKEVGIYFNGRRYLLKEGDTVGNNLKMVKILPNSIEVEYNNKTYWISK